MELFWQKYNFLVEIMQFDYEEDSHFDEYVQLLVLNFGDLCLKYANSPTMCAFFFYKFEELPKKNINDELEQKINNIKNKLIKI